MLKTNNYKVLADDRLRSVKDHGLCESNQIEVEETIRD